MYRIICVLRYPNSARGPFQILSDTENLFPPLSQFLSEAHNCLRCMASPKKQSNDDSVSPIQSKLYYVVRTPELWQSGHSPWHLQETAPEIRLSHNEQKAQSWAMKCMIRYTKQILEEVYGASKGKWLEDVQCLEDLAQQHGYQQFLENYKILNSEATGVAKGDDEYVIWPVYIVNSVDVDCWR